MSGAQNLLRAPSRCVAHIVPRTWLATHRRRPVLLSSGATRESGAVRGSTAGRHEGTTSQRRGRHLGHLRRASARIARASAGRSTWRTMRCMHAHAARNGESSPACICGHPSLGLAFVGRLIGSHGRGRRGARVREGGVRQGRAREWCEGVVRESGAREWCERVVRESGASAGGGGATRTLRCTSLWISSLVAEPRRQFDR